jgi:GT2 family glycosyltransferase
MLSVVIPSLGGDSILKTISSLNSGTVIPDEILICMPSLNHGDSLDIDIKNVKILNAEVYGQVAQRSYGFLKARCQYVLQLDDDILLEKNCIEKLIEQMKNSRVSCSISPYLINSVNQEPLFEVERNNFLSYFYYYLLNGREKFKSGSISLAGICFGVNKENFKKKTGLIAVDWQSGGCVLHKKKNLILNDYYPFSGKAYSEDLIHSYLLKKRGISLFVELGATAYTNVNNDELSFKELYYEFKAKKYYVKLASLSTLRMYVFYVLFILKKITLKVFKR